MKKMLTIITVVVSALIIVVAGVLIYFRVFVKPLDKEGMVFSQTDTMESQEGEATEIEDDFEGGER